MNTSKFCVLLLFTCASKLGLACTVTLNPGTNVVAPAVSSASTGATICLNTGTYIESSTIQLKYGQTLEGLGTSNTSTIIESSRSDFILQMEDYTSVENLFIKSTVSPGNQVGIEVRNDTSAVVQGVKISFTVDPIHVFHSEWVGFYDVTTISNGNPNSVWYDGQFQQKPDPSIYIYDSSNIEILYGYYEGASNGPGGDGEIQCANSSYFLIEGTQIKYTGASNAYFNNCDNATITGANLYGSDEWGIDVVNGSTNFTATGNTVTHSAYGAAVFQENVNGPGTFNSNIFSNNNLSHTRNCEGINVDGTQTNVDITPSNTMYYDSSSTADDQERCAY